MKGLQGTPDVSAIRVEEQRPDAVEMLLRAISEVSTGGADVRPSWHYRVAPTMAELESVRQQAANREAWLRRRVPDGVEVVNPVLGARRALGAGGTLVVRPAPEWLR